MKLTIKILLVATLFSQLIIVNAQESSRSKSNNEKNLILELTRTTPETVIAEAQPTMIIFDTSRTEAYYYEPFIELAKASNFKVTYYPFSKLLDTPLDQIPLLSCDCGCFILCSEFLKTLHSSAISQKIVSIIDKFSKMETKITGLFFPPIQIDAPSPIIIFSPLFKNFNLNNISQTNIKQFLQSPFERRSIAYHTTLRNPSYTTTSTLSNPLPALNQSQTIVQSALLPLKKECLSKELENLFPLGTYAFSAKYNNHLLVSRSSLFCSGISENFQLCPFTFELRKKLHEAITEMITELYQISTQNKQTKGIDIQKILATKPTKLPDVIEQIGKTTTNTQSSKKYKVAWMDLTVFEPQYKHKGKSKQQTKLTEYILNANLDYLWITINPNMYYSPIARNKTKTDDFLQTISSFTKMLSKHAAKKNVSPPPILIGFEITNNIYPPNLPKNNAHDLYGNVYEDVPSPLNQRFWKDEITNPLLIFMKKWNQKEISNGIHIGGVIFDLEMYCRKTTEAFLPTMGFGDKTKIKYIKPPLAYSISSNNFAQYLMDNKKSTDYFAYLENQATILGENLYQSIREELPTGVIGCYAPNISTDWFYKGFYKGLSTNNHPIFLLTFNAEFSSHKNWLSKNDIQAHHLCPLMLAKIRNSADLQWANHILKHHDGIWFNRFSRLIEEPHDDWSYLEQTGLPMNQRKEIINFTKKLSQ